MATTPNLQLETNNSSTDGQKKFLTYRMGQNGDISSNATKIDAWAGNVNKKLTTLENSKPAVLVNATWVSVGYYEVVTEEIKEYKVDMLITVRLNKDNDGTTTIKVNDLQVKSLLKYNSEGTLVNVDEKDLRKNHEYQFRYDGTSFVWQNGTSADQISTQGTSGNVIKISQSNTMEDSGIAIGNGELTTTDKTLVGSINEIKTSNDGKIDTTQIKNTLEETVEGNVLDATKGKELNDKIGDTTTLTTTDKTSTVAAINEMNNADTTGSLANKLSILTNLGFGQGTSKRVSNCNDANKNGIYTVFWNVNDNSNKPIMDKQFTFQTIVESQTFSYQIGMSYMDADSTKKLFWRYCNFSSNKYGVWTELATTDKIDILCTPKPNITLATNESKQVNNVAYIKLRVTGTFAVGARIEVCTLPFSVSGNYPISATGFSSSGQGMNVQCVCAISGNTLFLLAKEANNGMFDIGGVVLL